MFTLNLASPEKKLVTAQELEEITLPAFSGELNILPGHAPLMTTMEPGVLKYRLKNHSEIVKVAISWGYCQVSPTSVNVLAENVMLAGEIDAKVVANHLRTQETRLATESLSDVQWTEINREIGRLRAELNLAHHP